MCVLSVSGLRAVKLVPKRTMHHLTMMTMIIMMTMKITLMLIQRSSLSNSVLMLYMTGCKTMGYVSTRLKLMSLCSQSSVNWSVRFWFCHANIIDCQKPRSHTRPFAVLWPACCECLQFVLQPHPSTSTHPIILTRRFCEDGRLQ